MRNTTKKKWAAIVCTVVVILVLAVYLGGLLFAGLSEEQDMIAVWLILGVYGAGIVAVIVGVVFALSQRLKEIEGGEEEDAKQY